MIITIDKYAALETKLVKKLREQFHIPEGDFRIDNGTTAILKVVANKIEVLVYGAFRGMNAEYTKPTKYHQKGEMKIGFDNASRDFIRGLETQFRLINDHPEKLVAYEIASAGGPVTSLEIPSDLFEF